MNISPQAVERRRSIRANAVLPARILFFNEERVDQGRTPINISVGGARLATEREFEIGAQVGIEVYDFDDQPIPLTALADVVRYEPAPGNGRLGQVALRFISIRETDRIRVEKFVVQNLKTSGPA